MSQTPSLNEVLRASAEIALRGLHVAMPGQIKSYDKAQQRATVQPMLPYQAVGEDGNPTFRRYAPITNVPVVHFGSGSWSITVPVKPGDQVWLVFAERSLDQWLQNGTIANPKIDRRHHLNDAFAFLGARPFGSPIDGPPDDAMVLTGDKIQIGSKDASGAVVVEDALVDLVAAFNAASQALGSAGAPGVVPKVAVDAIITAINALNGGQGLIAHTTKAKAE